jgi:hypothetical protein
MCLVIYRRSSTSAESSSTAGAGDDGGDPAGAVSLVWRDVFAPGSAVNSAREASPRPVITGAVLDSFIAVADGRD